MKESKQQNDNLFNSLKKEWTELTEKIVKLEEEISNLQTSRNNVVKQILNLTGKIDNSDFNSELIKLDKVNISDENLSSDSDEESDIDDLSSDIDSDIDTDSNSDSD